MTEHRLPLEAALFLALVRGERCADHRWMKDRAFEPGDVAIFEETVLGGRKTGRTQRRRITYVDRDTLGIRRDYGMLHLGLEEPVRKLTMAEARRLTEEV